MGDVQRSVAIHLAVKWLDLSFREAKTIKNLPQLSVNKLYFDWGDIRRFECKSFPLKIVANSSVEGIFKTATGGELHCHENSLIDKFDVRE